MLLTKESSNKSRCWSMVKPLLWLAASIVFLVFVIYPIYLTQLTKGKHEEPIYCDMEYVWQGDFISNGKWFSNGHNRSADASRSGKYSAKLGIGETAQYGAGYELTVLPGKNYEAKVWVYTENINAKPSLWATNDSLSLYLNASWLTPAKANTWTPILLNFSIPVTTQEEKVKVFTATEGKTTVYFDDLSIREVVDSQSTISKEEFTRRKLIIDINEKQFKALEKERSKALKNGLIISDDDSWVKADLIEDSLKVPVSIRLKGDWLDHLQGDKWSFRVKVKSPYTWNRFKTFSLHSPETRYFLWEWMIHQLYEKEDVLTTSYDFVDLYFNGKYLGIYAYEEHFDKQLVESRNRREGPLLRMTEDGMWDHRLRTIQYSGLQHTNPFHHASALAQNADIEAFHANKTMSSPLLKEQYEIASQLLYQYQHGLRTPGEIFDLDQLAKFYAITDFMGAWHGLVWHNIRYYYNPVISKLEPVAYDAYDYMPRDPIFMGRMPKRGLPGIDAYPNHFLFYDKPFQQLYLEYMLYYTSEEYLNKFIAEIEKGALQRLAYLRTEFKDFDFNFEEIRKRHAYVHNTILPYKEHSIKVDVLEKEDTKQLLRLRNLHITPIEILGTGAYPNRVTNRFSEPIFLLPSPDHQDTLVEFVDVPATDKFVFYKGPKIDSVFHASIPKSIFREGDTYAQQIFRGRTLKPGGAYVLEGKTVRFPGDKKHKVYGHIVIPEGYEVIMEAGLELDFLNGTMFLSKSPVKLLGTKENPIKIHSSDKTGRGFSVLQKGQVNELRHVIFDQLNTLDQGGWKLTGAVNFYEADIKILNCQFNNNSCEDALNIIRSTVDIQHSIIRNTFSDGLDLDFCTGQIKNCGFFDTGNDGIDVSGSDIIIEACQLVNCGDKGISVGEQSKAIVRSASVTESVIGVASKDLSEVTIDYISLTDCNQGFAAYQKKPEFGPASIQVKKYEAKGLRYLHTIFPGCTLVLPEQTIVGDEKNM